MRLQKQAHRHDPASGVWGDCHRTCVAMVSMCFGAPRFCNATSTAAEWVQARL